MTMSFWSWAQGKPDHLALVEPDGREVRAGELLARANQLVHGLRAFGLGKGARVAAVLPNGAPMFELYLAALQAGWYLVPINNHLTESEIAHILEDSEAAALVADARFAASAIGAAEGARIPAAARFSVGEIAGFRPYSQLFADQPSTLPEGRSAGGVMNYTSGTTGRPKGLQRPGLPLDPDTVAGMMSGFQMLFGIQPWGGGVHLCGSPLYHTAALFYATNALHFGHTVVLMDRWTPEGFLGLVAERRATTTHMVPTQFHRLLGLPESVRARYDVSSLRHAIHSAAPCPVEEKKRMMEWWGPVLFEYYAASEGGGTFVTPQDWLAHPGTVGRPWPGAAIRILDDNGNECPVGEIGTVYMALNPGGFEYHRDKQKTEASRRDGFFTVGDMGRVDADGYLYLCDRKHDMIISRGTNIYPAEVEAALLAHPHVADAAVFGIPHEEWGEEVKAVIELVPGVTAGPGVAAEILASCAERLAKYKMPRTVDFVDRIPRDQNGKLYRRKLRDPFWAGRERAI